MSRTASRPDALRGANGGSPDGAPPAMDGVAVPERRDIMRWSCGTLNEHWYVAALSRQVTGRKPFAMLAPSLAHSPHYRLYAELPAAAVEELALAVDRELRRAHHYALCRSLGQLGAVRGVSVRDGHRIYERACAERGQRAGAIKPPALECAPGWERVFEEDAEPVLR